jgi:hypothetical protein
MTDPIVMSSSSLSTMLRCPKQWEFAYVHRIKEPPKVRMVIGTATHKGVETNLVQKIESQIDLPINDVLDAYSTEFDREVASVEKPEEPVGPAKDQGAGLMKLHHLRVAPSIQPLAVERETKFTINGHEYQTYIDYLGQRPTGVRVGDTKTTQQARDGTNYIFQMIAGAIGYRQATGKTEADIQLDMLVRTQTPKYHVINWGPLTSSAIGVFAKQVEYANTMAKAGLFPATGIQNHACSSCGYQARCPAYQAAYGSHRVNP